MTTDFMLFSIFYFIISFGLIYPPAEFISAGFTIQNLFSGFLGSEKETFIRYHMKKSMLNLFVYSCLPFMYIMLLFLLGFVEEFRRTAFGWFSYASWNAGGSYVCLKLFLSFSYVWEISALLMGTTMFWKLFAGFSLTAPMLAAVKNMQWAGDNYKNHPIVINLMKCSNNNNTWSDVACDIENEFRRPGIVSMKTNPIVKVVVTENWIMKVTPFTIFVTHQSDATLSVKEANTYQMSHIDSEAQFLNIEVKSSRPRIDTFTIRINSSDFKDLENRLARSINIMPEVKFHKSVTDQFLDVFKDTIQKNPQYNTDMELSMECIGCLQARPEIKIQKQCQDAEGGRGNNCTNCFCRPMWCVNCIAKWFTSRQDQDRKSEWLSSKCTCPMCRATFCVLDVSLIAINEE